MREGWEIKKLGEICEILDSQRKPVTKKYRKEGLYPYYGASGIQDYVDSYIFDGRYLLVGEDGAKWGTNDKSAFIIEGKCWVNNHAHILKVYDNLKDSFIEYYLVFKDLNEYITGAIVPKLTQQALKNIPIPVPSLSEQEKIVAELDCLSGIIEKKKQQLKELDSLAQSIFYEMFGDPVENEKGWEVAPLKESVIEMFLGPFGSALKTECYVNQEDSFCMVYEQKHAIRKTLDTETHYINKEKFESLKRFEVHSGDFIMSCRGTIGEIYRLPSNAPLGIIHPSLMKIRIKEDKYSSTFFVNLLSYIIKNECTVGNCIQMAITAKELGQRKSILPPLSLQQQFANKIELIEKQKELIKQSIKETETLFDSRMDYYFNS
jgi:type I restriction enzyme S subunit